MLQLRKQVRLPSSCRYLGAQFWDCSPSFLVPGTRSGDRRINGALMLDGRQPNAAGMHRLGLCLDSVIHHLVVDQPPILPDLEDEVLSHSWLMRPKLDGAGNELGVEVPACCWTRCATWTLLLAAANNDL